jgi:hypothetical protein
MSYPKAQKLNYSNFYESTITTSSVASGDTSFDVSAAPTSDGSSAIAAPFYLVIDPDTASKREVVEVTNVSSTTLTVVRDVEGRHGTDPTHSSGTVIRMAVVGQMFDDLEAYVDGQFDDASNIASGVVSTTEFEHLNGVTSAIQTQINGKLSLSGGTLSGAVNAGDQEVSAVVLKDYAETDVVVTSGTTLTIDLSAGNTGSVTLAHSVTDIDFTNVPTNGVSSFTLKVTQDGTGSRTMATNAVTVNTSAATVKTAGGAGLTLSTGANDIDLVTFLFFDADATNVLVNSLLDFS